MLINHFYNLSPFLGDPHQDDISHFYKNPTKISKMNNKNIKWKTKHKPNQNQKGQIKNKEGNIKTEKSK